MDVLAVCGMMCGTRASDDHNKLLQDNVIVPLIRTIRLKMSRLKTESVVFISDDLIEVRS